MIPQHQQTTRAFTLVELVIIVTLISILAMIGYIAYGGVQARAREAIVRSDLTAAADILHVDKIRSGGVSYPLDMGDADKGQGLPASEGTNYQYSADNDPEPTFCLTAINDSVTMHITEDSTPELGACVGHSSV
jgi:Tfp pilus assembly protein PilE